VLAEHPLPDIRKKTSLDIQFASPIVPNGIH